MLTRCPACETHFRVTPEQLKARSGRVRCGQCRQLFNALDVLIEEPMQAMAQARREALPSPEVNAFPPEPAAEAIPGTDVTTDEIAASPAPTLDLAVEAPADAFPPDLETPLAEESAESPESTESTESPEPATADHEILPPEPVEPALAGTALESPETSATGLPPESEIDATAPDWSETFPEPTPPPRRWPWVIGSLLALAAIGLQAVLAFRVELAVLWPESKPALMALCDVTGCEVGLPARVALVGIEASDLHPDTGQAGRLALTATLKNRAPFAQQFPHLELTLTDTADKAIARKVLAPTDYLPPKTSVAGGMPPGVDITLGVGIDAREMTASGYRLYLFYP